MEIQEDIVIVGAGLAGLTTSLGLHRLGLRSLVLESSENLRITGFAIGLWTNAWRALDAVGVGDSLRQHSLQLQGFRVATTVSDLPTETSLDLKRLKSFAEALEVIPYTLVENEDEPLNSYFFFLFLLTSTPMEIKEDIVIVGAGIAGLTTSLGLYRLGLRSLVLESSDSLRTAGFALELWTNAWKALDAVGVGDSLRQCHTHIQGSQVASNVSGLPTAEISFKTIGKQDPEIRCVRRKVLLESLEKELPLGSIRYSSKVVSIEESRYFKLVHLADGFVIRTKVLIGCDGVNSVVANWLGLQKPVCAGRSSIRGFAEFLDDHGFEPKLYMYFGGGVRYGLRPCDEKSLYWFLSFTPSIEGKNDIIENPARMKQFVLSKLGKVPQQVEDVVEKTELDNIICSQQKLRWPWRIILGDIVKGNVCVAGDALHPMTPEIGQGGCAALEDGIVLARCLADAFLTAAPGRKTREDMDEEEYRRIKMGLEKFAKERRWRSCKIITTSYVMGWIQQSKGWLISFLREKVLSRLMARSAWKIADYDCGKLKIS
ncbi:hypothetical protein F0562_027091 [Nyssa sinensis]|uniref:FAD-binding domain-containing protein n=1 Tax=Nyssa sinensis TaxID=561372 RepID=A0A5J5B2L7_9ASTE|nr:hypothetical protein F0562_027091 [Nyssa sinensis]